MVFTVWTITKETYPDSSGREAADGRDVSKDLSSLSDDGGTGVDAPAGFLTPIDGDAAEPRTTSSASGSQSSSKATRPGRVEDDPQDDGVSSQPFDPLVDPLVGLPDSDEDSSEDLGTEVPTPGENRLFTLSLSGTIGGEPIPPNDLQTWARVGYFLQQSRGGFRLVFPSGSIPLILKKGANGKLTTREGPSSEGNSSSPAYRIVLEANARTGGAVKIYGGILAGSYSCKIKCSLERRQEDGWKSFRRFSVSESITKQATSSKYRGMVYEEAVKKLVRELRRVPLFRQK